MSKRNTQTFLGNGTNKKTVVYYDSDLAEYHVKYFFDGKHKEESDYFSNDRVDALETAQLMVK